MARASKRAENVIKFIETYCYVPEGKYVGKKLKLEPFQKKFITSVYTSNRRVRRAYLSIARKNGKALCLDTKLPTPDGWVRMGDVKEGDVLFDEKGNKCRVTFATPVQHKRNCFRVRFADGAEIIADADHQWTVNSRSRRGKEVTLTTAQMVGDYILDSNRDTHVERNYSVSVAGSVKCDETNLIVEPYALGAWLGDGDSAQAALTGSVEDGTLIAAEIERRGTIIRRIADGRTASRWSFSDGVKNRSKKCVQKDLREIKVLHNKHIPIEYQRSSVDQRMSLLRGLMDTDGSISKAGQCEFVSVSKTLAFDTMSLIRGLGFKASMKIDRARVNGKDCGPRYRVQFWSTKDNSVFHLPRKHERQKDALGARNSRNYIVAIEPVESVPVRCIQVDSPSSLFLAGEAFTPTHNTAFIAAILLAHIVGPEAVLNSQIISGARSRDQAALVFNLAVKMIHLNPELESRCRIIPSGKKIIGLARNVEFHAVSAEAGTAHGLSPILAILDEVGQVRGDHDAFIEAIETSQGAYDEPLLIAISTQAATDGDLFSMWLDDAKASKDPAIVSHLYSAPEDCDIMDRKAWYAANPALGKFRSLPQLEREMEQASRLPSKENSARWLYLNQRIEASSPFLSRKLWQECLTDHSADFTGLPIYGGLDLSEVADLTACVLIAKIDDKWHTKPTFWLPGELSLIHI